MKYLGIFISLFLSLQASGQDMDSEVKERAKINI